MIYSKLSQPTTPIFRSPAGKRQNQSIIQKENGRLLTSVLMRNSRDGNDVLLLFILLVIYFNLNLHKEKITEEIWMVETGVKYSRLLCGPSLSC